MNTLSWLFLYHINSEWSMELIRSVSFSFLIWSEVTVDSKWIYSNFDCICIRYEFSCICGFEVFWEIVLERMILELLVKLLVKVLVKLLVILLVNLLVSISIALSNVISNGITWSDSTILWMCMVLRCKRYNAIIVLREKLINN